MCSTIASNSSSSLSHDSNQLFFHHDFGLTSAIPTAAPIPDRQLLKERTGSDTTIKTDVAVVPCNDKDDFVTQSNTAAALQETLFDDGPSAVATPLGPAPPQPPQPQVRQPQMCFSPPRRHSTTTSLTRQGGSDCSQTTGNFNILAFLSEAQRQSILEKLKPSGATCNQSRRDHQSKNNHQSHCARRNTHERTMSTPLNFSQDLLSQPNMCTRTTACAQHPNYQQQQQLQQRISDNVGTNVISPDTKQFAMDLPAASMPPPMFAHNDTQKAAKRKPVKSMPETPPEGAVMVPSGAGFRLMVPFPWRLHEMLEEVSEDPERRDVVSWLPCGTAFRIYQPKFFSESVAPGYFRHKNYKSFQRQLYLYGFTGVADIQGAYRHDHFVRSDRKRCQHITRTKSTVLAKRSKEAKQAKKHAEKRPSERFSANNLAATLPFENSQQFARAPASENLNQSQFQQTSQQQQKMPPSRQHLPPPAAIQPNSVFDVPNPLSREEVLANYMDDIISIFKSSGDEELEDV